MTGNFFDFRNRGNVTLRHGDELDQRLRHQAIVNPTAETRRSIKYRSNTRTNIMFVAVAERTREIGIRKALGAKRRAILLQFLMEAVVLCNIGGVLGVVVGFGLGNIVSLVTDFAVHIPMEWAVRGVAFCTTIGLIFGMWPAIRASRLAPIEALRYE